MRLAVVAAVLLLIGQGAGWCVDADGDYALSIRDWMSRLDGNLTLAQINIPGSHNSCALHEPFKGTARCQSLTIAEQLNAGVRFLDIRCRRVKDAFLIYHGIADQRLSFDDVMMVCADFLRKHPGEALILLVKEEAEPVQSSRSFEDIFADHVRKNPNIWLPSCERVPSLKESRGRMFLLRRFPVKENRPGMNACDWPANTTFATPRDRPRLRVQDQFVVHDPAEKWKTAQEFFAAAADADPAVLHINFLSGYKPGFAGIPDIIAVSSVVNPAMSAWIARHPGGRLGVTVMDFVDANVCRLLIETNRH